MAEALRYPSVLQHGSSGHAEVAQSGDLGYTRGTYETRLTAPDDGEVIEKGKFVSIWRRQVDGMWLIVVETYNTDAPPPAHR